jgi:hypothetical protein
VSTIKTLGARKDIDPEANACKMWYIFMTLSRNGEKNYRPIKVNSNLLATNKYFIEK